MEFSKQIAAFLLVIIVVAGGCVKDPQDIPSGVTNPPVFGIQGAFGLESVSLKAGQDEWTALPVSQTQDSVIIFSSIFSQNGCLEDCQSSWVFKLFQHLDSTQTEEVTFYNTVVPGAIDFAIADQERVGHDIRVETHPDLFAGGFSFWENLNNPQEMFGSVFTTFVPYNDKLNVCFHSYSYLGCQYNQCIEYDPHSGPPCQAYIQTQLLEASNFLSLLVRPQGSFPFSVEWMNGANTNSILLPLSDSSSTVYANVRVTDANNNKMEISQSIIIRDGFVDACFYPIAIESIPFTNMSLALAAGDMEIVHIDADGQEWRSTAGIQPADMIAVIGERESYEDSPFGEKSVIVTLDVKVQLTNPATGESRVFQANQIKLPFGYKD